MAGKNSKIKILFASYEATPFSKSGGLGDVAGSLPQYIKNDEFDVRVILPLINFIPEKFRNKMQFVCKYNVPLGWRNCYCGLFRLRHGGVTYYFIDNEYYFNRSKYYGEFDDAERMAFFSKAILETVRHISKNYMPDLIHCNDWHTALLPVYLHEHYRDVPGFDRIKTVFTIHNLKFQGIYDPCIIGDVLGLQGTPAEKQLMFGGAANYIHATVLYSDAVTTVSSTYANEICTKAYGEGLEGLFRSRKYKLSGIVNGIDTDDIDPSKDERIVANYNSSDLSGKQKCKLELQKELGFKQDPDVPLFVMVSRLTTQKGANLLIDLMHEFAQRNMQLAILGTGDSEYENSLKRMSEQYPHRIASRIMFNEPLSRRFYSGADAFLMPSQFEPCGLAQMMAMRYGTLPIVRETGGLKDTVKGYWDFGSEATGFSFKDFDTNALRTTVDKALDIWFNERALWVKMQHNAMSADFSWVPSAEKYRDLYKKLV